MFVLSEQPLFLSTLTTAANKLDVFDWDLLHGYEPACFNSCSFTMVLLVVGLLVLEGLSEFRLLGRELLLADNVELRLAHLLPHLISCS